MSWSGLSLISIVPSAMAECVVLAASPSLPAMFGVKPLSLFSGAVLAWFFAASPALSPLEKLWLIFAPIVSASHSALFSISE